MEQQVLSVLDFELNVPTLNYFVEIFTLAINLADYPLALSSVGFLVDLAILFHVEMNYSPAIIALSALHLTFFRMSETPRFGALPAHAWSTKLEQIILTENFS